MDMINSAMQHLSKKTYSKRELCDVLKAQHGALPDLNTMINKTLNYLEHHGLVNDRRLAQSIAYYYVHKGDNYIRNTLSQRKINSEYINTVLMDLPDEYTRAWEETKKRLTNILHVKSKKEQINIVTRFLSGRQFSHLIIGQITNKLDSKVFYHQVHAVEEASWSIHLQQAKKLTMTKIFKKSSSKREYVMNKLKITCASVLTLGSLLTGCAHHPDIKVYPPNTVPPSPYTSFSPVQVYPHRTDIPPNSRIIGKVTAQNKKPNGVQATPGEIIEELKRQAALLGGNGIWHITPGTSQTTANAVVSY